ncbi:RNA 2',3'-cyclic phosphodiesterase [Ideonella sp. DXS29W]|uniref:RNA 2',3'-cyclic phosphodiesterase n=1 Tax=Ideonella lacteola TaxID=2984193 RepID=A0ABU9BM40_9BURK
MNAPTRDPARLFLALWPAEAQRQSLHDWQQAVRWTPAARLTPAEHLHLTLHFIGPVPRIRLDELASGLALAWDPIDLVLDRFSVWPRGIAVLEPGGRTPPALQALHDALAQRLFGLDLPVETRPFRPHVTLARRADGAKLVSDAGPQALRWRANAGHVLVESAGGYRVLQHFAA